MLTAPDSLSHPSHSMSPVLPDGSTRRGDGWCFGKNAEEVHKHKPGVFLLAKAAWDWERTGVFLPVKAAWNWERTGVFLLVKAAWDWARTGDCTVSEGSSGDASHTHGYISIQNKAILLIISSESLFYAKIWILFLITII